MESQPSRNMEIFMDSKQSWGMPETPARPSSRSSICRLISVDIHVRGLANPTNKICAITVCHIKSWVSLAMNYRHDCTSGKQSSTPWCHFQRTSCFFKLPYDDGMQRSSKQTNVQQQFNKMLTFLPKPCQMAASNKKKETYYYNNTYYNLHTKKK